MHEIICPNCKKVFKVDGASYAEIVLQVRDSIFEQQLNARVSESIANAEMMSQSRLENELQRVQAQKDSEIQQLMSQLEAVRLSHEAALATAASAARAERDELASRLQQETIKAESIEELSQSRLENELQRVQAQKDTEIQQLKSQICLLYTSPSPRDRG